MLEAGPGFFDTLRIPLLYGRVFDARDRTDSPRVAVAVALSDQASTGGATAAPIARQIMEAALSG